MKSAANLLGLHIQGASPGQAFLMEKGERGTGRQRKQGRQREQADEGNKGTRRQRKQGRRREQADKGDKQTKGTGANICTVYLFS